MNFSSVEKSSTVKAWFPGTDADIRDCDLCLGGTEVLAQCIGAKAGADLERLVGLALLSILGQPLLSHHWLGGRRRVIKPIELGGGLDSDPVVVILGVTPGTNPSSARLVWNIITINQAVLFLQPLQTARLWLGEFALDRGNLPQTSCVQIQCNLSGSRIEYISGVSLLHQISVTVFIRKIGRLLSECPRRQRIWFGSLGLLTASV